MTVDTGVRLCSLTAGWRSEMCPTATMQALMSKIYEVLRESPPLRPSTAAVDLLLAVGRLQVCSLTINHTTAALQRQCSFCKCQLAASRSGHTHQSVPHCEASFRGTTHSSFQCAGLSSDVGHIAGSWHARLPGRPSHLLATHCVLDRQHSGATTALLLHTTALGHCCCQRNALQIAQASMHNWKHVI